MKRNLSVVLGLVILLILGSLATGCSKKSDVETDPEATAGQGEVEQIPDTPVVEEPEVIEVVVPDYAAMSPSEYGVEDVFFDFDQYELDAESMGILSRTARILRETGVTILVSGHCDERGTVEYNLALGEKRANAVKDYLVSLGVPASKLRVTSYGESKPFVMGHTEDAWAMNRRAHFERP